MSSCCAESLPLPQMPQTGHQSLWHQPNCDFPCHEAVAAASCQDTLRANTGSSWGMLPMTLDLLRSNHLGPSLQPVPSYFFLLMTNSISAHFCLSQVPPFHTATMSQRPFPIQSLLLILPLQPHQLGLWYARAPKHTCAHFRASSLIRSHPRAFPAASVS